MTGGDDLIGELRAWLDRFIVTLNGDDTLVLALWVLHTYLATETYTSPRLLIDSTMPGSGKTTCLEHLHRLSFAAVQMAALSSPAMLTRMLDTGPRTILIDEADRSLRTEKDGVEDLLAVLNSGYKRGGTRPVLVPAQGGGWDVKEMPTFAPVALAGNNPNLPDDTRSRCIRVLLLPDMHGLAEDSDWELIEADADALAVRVAAWAESVRHRMGEYRADLPPGVRGRFKEKWRPLRRVAQAAGGAFVADVDRLANADVEQAQADREDGLVKDRPAMVLLRDLRDVWPDGRPFVPTTELIRRLTAAHPESWGTESPFGKELTAQRLGRMLSQGYRVNSVRQGGVPPRGYRLTDLEPMFRRMLTPTRETDGTGGTDGTDGHTAPSAASSATSVGSAGLQMGGAERPAALMPLAETMSDVSCDTCGQPMSAMRVAAGASICAACVHNRVQAVSA